MYVFNLEMRLIHYLHAAVSFPRVFLMFAKWKQKKPRRHVCIFVQKGCKCFKLLLWDDWVTVMICSYSTEKRRFSCLAPIIITFSTHVLLFVVIIPGMCQWTLNEHQLWLSLWWCHHARWLNVVDVVAVLLFRPISPQLVHLPDKVSLETIIRLCCSDLCKLLLLVSECLWVFIWICVHLDPLQQETTENGHFATY